MTRIHPGYHRVIGIDLGTTYSAVAAHSDEREETLIVSNRETLEETTPSVVSLDRARRQVMVGQMAKRNLAADPANTVIEIKREMGEIFTPELIRKYDPRGEKRFVAKEDRPGGASGDPVEVKFCGEWFRPQEISAFTLMKMKEIAEAELGGEILDAVITVPAYFKVRHRKATEEAARLAGIYPRQLIPEPTAAAIAYGVDQYEQERRIYLVYDLGGGTFDVSIISVDGPQSITVKATAGDRRLGGGDFDDAITAWTVEQLLASHKLDVRNDPRGLAVIKFHAEKAKKELSTFESAKLVLMELRPAEPPVVEITRAKFEELIDGYLRKSLTCVDTALRYAQEQGVPREEIDAILLVGGSSKIPRVKTKLLEYFQRDDEFVRADVNPDTAVARGAAILARRIAPTDGPFDINRKFDDQQEEAGEDDVRVFSITEHTLGVGVMNEAGESVVSPVIPRGTNIPVAQTKGGFVNGGPSTEIEVHVFQGEGRYTVENELIGIVPLGPMDPMPPNHHHFEVTFSLDRNGLLTAVVSHINENKTYHATFRDKTSIGHDLGLLRERLMRMYRGQVPAGGSAAAADSAGDPPIVPPATASAVVPPATAANPGPATNGQGSPAVAASTAAVPAAAPAADVTAAPSAAPQIPAATVPAATVPAASAAAPQVRPGVAVPEQFKSVVRRTQKSLEKNPDDRLVAAFARFIDGLNRGIDEEELNSLGDTLEDVYHDCRG